MLYYFSISLKRLGATLTFRLVLANDHLKIATAYINDTEKNMHIGLILADLACG